MQCVVEDLHTEEECKIIKINKKIKTRIREFQSDEFIIKHYLGDYRLLRKPSYKLNWIGRQRLRFESDDKYHVLFFNVRNDTIYVQADNPKDVKNGKDFIPKIFEGIEDIKIIVMKMFCPMDYIR